MRTNAIALLAFAGFVALGIAVLVVRGRTDSARSRKRAVSILTLWVLGVSMVAVGSQRDLWPFSAWRLVVRPPASAVGDAPANQSLRIVGFDSLGVDHAVDYRAWQPLSVEELTTWLSRELASLDSAERSEIGRHLLGLANEGRRRAHAGERFGVSDRLFGPFAAPTELLHPRRWSARSAVPVAPFVGLRIYSEQFDLEELRAGGRIRLELLHEYRGDRP